MINPKVATFITSLSVVGLFELSYFQPEFFYWGVAILNLLLILTLRTFPGLNFSQVKYWNLLILPFLFLNSSLTYFSLISSQVFIHLLAVVATFFIFYYLRHIYLYLRDSYRLSSLVNFSSSGAILVLFFSAASIYGMRVNLYVSIWLLVLVLVLVVGLVTYQALWVNGINLKINLFYVLIVVLLLVELGWSLLFLSFTYHVLGVVLTICYYVIIGLIKFNLKNKLDTRRLKFYLGFGFTSIFLILFTARIL